MRYTDYNTQSVWKRIDQMLTEHFVNNPQDCKDSEIVAESLFNESEYQKWLKKPIHTFGTEVAFDMFNEAVNRAVCLVKNNYDAVDYNRINSKSDWEVDPVSINESAYFAPKRRSFFTEGVIDTFNDAEDSFDGIKRDINKNSSSNNGAWNSVINSISNVASKLAGGISRGTFKDNQAKNSQVVDTIKPINNTIGDNLTDFFECEENTPIKSDDKWYDEGEETLNIADIFNFQKKNDMKYIDATGIFNNEKNNKLKISVNKGSKHCQHGNGNYEIGISNGKKVEYFLDYEVNITINNEDGDIELSHKSNKNNEIFFKVKINEPIINITDEDELEPPCSGAFC